MTKSRMCLLHPDRKASRGWNVCEECLDDRERKASIERQEREELEDEEFRQSYLRAFGKYPEGYNP